MSKNIWCKIDLPNTVVNKLTAEQALRYAESHSEVRELLQRCPVILDTKVRIYEDHRADVMITTPRRVKVEREQTDAEELAQKQSPA